MVNSCKFVVDERYTPLKSIGTGAYGVVCSASDSMMQTKVAIKKCGNVFADLIDGKRVLREIKLLRHFHHENIIGLRDMMNPPLTTVFKDVYLVLDLMDSDLEKVIRSHNQLTDHHIKFLLYQVFRGLKYIHSANVIHRDLKPSNLLLNKDCDLKICDFGLARGVGDDIKLTKYVVTRWYRAPELLCSCAEYDGKIDVWSVGCILAELLGRKPLFPGSDYLKQLELIFQTLGKPSAAELQFVTNPKAYNYITNMTVSKKSEKQFGKLFSQANPLALDLLEKMLVFNPYKRLSVEGCLAHPYFRELHLPQAESVCKEPFVFEEMDLHSKEKLEEEMWNEIFHFRPQTRFIKEQLQKAGTFGQMAEQEGNNDDRIDGLHSENMQSSQSGLTPHMGMLSHDSSV